MDNNNQSRPAKMPGIVANLLALAALGNGYARIQANSLLTNGGRAPIPARFMNQRQKRKLAAQTR